MEQGAIQDEIKTFLEVMYLFAIYIFLVFHKQPCKFISTWIVTQLAGKLNEMALVVFPNMPGMFLYEWNGLLGAKDTFCVVCFSRSIRWLGIATVYAGQG